MAKRILSLDPSLTCYGYAVIIDNVLKECGSIKTQPIKGKLLSVGDTLRLDFLSKTLITLVTKYKIDEILFEEPAGSKSSRAGVALGMTKGLTIGIANGMGLSYRSMRAREIKELVTGDSTAEKDEIIKIVKQKFPNFTKLIKGYNQLQIEAAADAVGVYLALTKKKRSRSISK